MDMRCAHEKGFEKMVRLRFSIGKLTRRSFGQQVPNIHALFRRRRRPSFAMCLQTKWEL
jgi:hypothetical protein